MSLLCALEYTGATAEMLPKPKTQRKGETEVESTGKNLGNKPTGMRKKKKEKDQKHTNMPESGVVRSLTVSSGETGLYYNVSPY